LQAASGALIITTKKGGGAGKKGINIDLQSSYSADYANQFPELQNTFSQGNNGLYLGPLPHLATSVFHGGANVDTLYWDGVPTEYDQHGSIVNQSDPNAVQKVVRMIHSIFTMREARSITACSVRGK